MKRSIEETGSSDEDIFSYGNKIKLTFKHDAMNLSSSSSSSSSEESEESEDEAKELNISEEVLDEVCENQAPKNILIDEFMSPSPPPSVNKVTVGQNRSNATLHLLNQLQEQANFSPLTNKSFTVVDDVKIQLVKVRLHGLIQKFELGDDEPFENIFKQIAKRENVESSKISLTLKTQNIKPSDTLEKLKISIADILNGFVHSEKHEEVENENCISVQLQSSAKQRSKVMIHKNDKLSNLVDIYCSQNNVSRENVVMSFDGDVIDENKTATENDICDGDMIDVRVQEC